MQDLPHSILYATSARLGGSGLDAVAAESIRVAHTAGLLRRALSFENRQRAVPPNLINSLRWHPVRFWSWLESEYYYGAKKHALDAVAARMLRSGGFDLFHGWSGESLRTLRVARELGIPSIMEIPTWHRNKGKDKPARLTKSEREAAAARGWRGWKNRMLVTRQHMMEEYELADLLLVLSQKAEETFLAAGVPAKKLFRHQRGVDPVRFSPAEKPPDTFRAVFVGALIQRKGVDLLLRAWHRLALKDAELVLAGSLHSEIEPALKEFGGPTVRLAGHVGRIEDVYRSASVHIFPSTCEGSAKATYEAAACALPQIATRESGDIVQHERNGLIVAPGDFDGLCEAMLLLYRNPQLCAAYGAAARQRILDHFTWAHFDQRLMEAYRTARASR